MIYKLIKWYPSLPNDWEVGDKVDEFKGGIFPYRNVNEDKTNKYIKKEEIENNPKFWRKVKEPLFTTEDGVDIYEGDKYYWVNTMTWELGFNSARESSGNRKYHKNFSTREKAKDHVNKNRPLYSKKDVIKALEKATSADGRMRASTVVKELNL